MNYGNFYGNYPHYAQPPYSLPMQDNLSQLKNAQQNNNGLVWVQGEAGAKAYLVAPGNTVTLWDTESPTIYIKSADMSGVPYLRILDFTERGAPKTPENHVCQCGKDFVKIDDFKALEAKFEDLQGKLETLAKPKKAKGDVENA